jgi:4-hydroxy-tetrahydrodipicolinate synthase
MIQLLFPEPNPVPVKAALSIMGLLRDELRAPMQAASAKMREQLVYRPKQLDVLQTGRIPQSDKIEHPGATLASCQHRQRVYPA